LLIGRTNLAGKRLHLIFSANRSRRTGKTKVSARAFGSCYIGLSKSNCRGALDGYHS
jgi:hypothetical protein